MTRIDSDQYLDALRDLEQQAPADHPSRWPIRGQARRFPELWPIWGWGQAPRLPEPPPDCVASAASRSYPIPADELARMMVAIQEALRVVEAKIASLTPPAAAPEPSRGDVLAAAVRADRTPDAYGR